MTTTEALITAARRYCTQNYAYWVDRYSTERTGENFPYTYSDKDYDLFPRYNVLSAILAEVEVLVGKSEITNLTEVLTRVGRSAESLLTMDKQNAIKAAAMQNERDKFVHFVQTLTPEQLDQIVPLPHRRRLDAADQEAVSKKLLERWNYDGGYWDPVDLKCPSESLFLAKESITNEDYKAIMDFIHRYTPGYLLEITEEGAYVEIAHSEFHPNCYETVYTDVGFEWIIYGSHEGTVTFAGAQLLVFVKDLFIGRAHLFNQWPIAG